MADEEPRDAVRGQPILATEWNKLKRWRGRREDAPGFGVVDGVGTATGLVRSYRSGIAVISPHGPNGAPDLAGEMYWVALSHVDHRNSLDNSPALETTHLTTSAFVPETIRPATNLAERLLDVEFGGIAEYEQGTHLLRPGLHVHLFYELDPLGTRRYFFCRTPGGPETGFIIGTNHTRPGVYLVTVGEEPQAAFDPDNNAPLGIDELVTGTNATAYAVNWMERGAGTWALTAANPGISTAYRGRVRQRRATDGKLVIDFLGIAGKACETT